MTTETPAAEPVAEVVAEPKAMTVLESLNALRAKAHADLAAAEARVAELEAKVAAIPEKFHHLTAAEIWKEIEGWFGV